MNAILGHRSQAVSPGPLKVTLADAHMTGMPGETASGPRLTLGSDLVPAEQVRQVINTIARALSFCAAYSSCRLQGSNPQPAEGWGYRPTVQIVEDRRPLIPIGAMPSLNMSAFSSAVEA